MINSVSYRSHSGHAVIHAGDGTYMALAADPEALHRMAADEEHRAAEITHRASVYRAAADMWEQENTARAEAEAAKPKRQRQAKPMWMEAS